MKVIIAVDDKVFSEAIIAYSLSSLNLAGAEVNLITVIPAIGSYTALAMLPEVMQDLRAQSRKNASEILAQAKKMLIEHQHDAKVSELLIEGLPAEEILELSKHWDADTIVVGSHGKHGLYKIILGSVSQSVLSGANCSVVIVNLHRAVEAVSQAHAKALDDKKEPAESFFTPGIYLGN